MNKEIRSKVTFELTLDETGEVINLLKLLRRVKQDSLTDKTKQELSEDALSGNSAGDKLI